MAQSVSIAWEDEALEDRTRIFEFLYVYNPLAADKTDEEIEKAADMLSRNPEAGVCKDGFRGRCLVLRGPSLLVFYHFDGRVIQIVRVLHQKQKFPF
jgi:addiction module RelE/StbE family toxin